MSATPINLNKVRKARARAAGKAQADANAAAFGRSKAQKAAQRKVIEQADRTLDGAALETPLNGSDQDDKKT